MPHPDDETVFASGLMHKAVKNSVALKVIVATLGEKSTHRFRLPPEADLAQARQLELLKALQILGVVDHDHWDFPDGGLEDHAATLIKRLTLSISQFKPTHVLTIEPDGVYGHPDHIALTQYVQTVTPESIHLLYATVTPHFVFPKARKMAKKAVISPITAEFRLQLHWREVQIKWKAMKAHSSQFKLNLFDLNTIGRFIINQMLTHEHFTFRKK